MIKTALISVSKKEGIVDFAVKLRKQGIAIISTGNTAELLRKNGVEIALVSDITKFPQMLNGRVKSMHPIILGGILADRGSKRHEDELKKMGITPIDIVVVNFYPFEEKFEKNRGIEVQNLIEDIDIGGPCLARAAAKNHKDVLVLVDPADYDEAADRIENGKLSYEYRLNLAAKAFSQTARYDSIIGSCFNISSKNQFPDILNLTFTKIQPLRYGENPHQTASFYRDFYGTEKSVSTARQLCGKDLSFNNILDINAAFELVKDFKNPTAAIIKHTNPSGVASASTIEQAYSKAYETDSKSAFGCIVALNKECSLKAAQMMKPLFIEAIICPKFEPSALKILKEKKNLRLLETGQIGHDKNSKRYDIKKVTGGVLLQSDKWPNLYEKNLKVVTKRKPTKKELKSLIFAWKVNKHVKSNSIVLAKEDVTVGIGAGQMSRVDAVNLAITKSQAKSRGSAMSSDAFFPFKDGVEKAAKAGITAIIQPGGSIRDDEVIGAANKNNIAMVFTGIRLFRH